jgi:cytoskeletal protein RodZ
MKLTGQKLKEKRESARLTISEVSLATKINPKVLTAMEAGDAEHLPAKTFLRGFVRAYAGFLKMNVAEVLELFTQETGEGAQKEVVASQAQAPEVKTKPKKETASKVDVDGEGSGTFRMFVIGGILVLIVLIIGVRSVVQKYERERSVDAASDLSASKVTPLEDKTAPEEKKSEEAPASSVVPGEANSNMESATAAGPASPTVTPPAAPSPATASPSPAPVAVAPVVPKAEPPKPVEPAKAEAPKPPEPAKAEPAKTVAKGKRHEIILEALDKVDISYKTNGQSKKIAMAPGQVRTIVTEEPISFDVSDGGALNITDNGRDKGPAGDLGHRKQVSVP